MTRSIRFARVLNAFRRKLRLILGMLLLLATLPGCIATRTPVTGLYEQPPAKNQAPPTSVLFHFSNQTQNHGMDTIPKVQTAGVKDFDNLFRDALREFGNIERYDTFVDLPGDVNNPERRAKLDAAKKSHNYTIEMTILEESSFQQQCFSGTITLLSLSLVPMPYDWQYTVSTRVFDKNGQLLKTYQRRSTLSSWVEAFFLFLYPFYPIEGKREEIYSISMHDTFRQIESEQVLK